VSALLFSLKHNMADEYSKHPCEIIKYLLEGDAIHVKYIQFISLCNFVARDNLSVMSLYHTLFMVRNLHKSDFSVWFTDTMTSIKP